ncbi:O-antigen ligase-like membrane protein [Inmirania thermothiophila]|uniref:O-antigen ligase-like membrane protein n=2 Tax=Inmirania thermothiophila TaxID=1750597 RepID=A0A3N1Y8K8_9GAMM|nr:O-antigen ligase-like membrane protein [Inmirania thermothiophila]
MAVGVALAVVADDVGYAFLVAGVLIIPIGVGILISVPAGWSKVKRLSRRLGWWHVFWALYFLGGLTFRVRDTESTVENPLDAAAFYRVALVGIVGIILLGALTLRRGLGLNRVFGGLIGLLSLYAFVCIASTLWSVYPSWTLYKSLEYVLGVVLIGVIVASMRSEVQFKSLFDWTWLLVGLETLSVWVGVILRPEEAISQGVGLLGIQIHGLFPRVAANGVGDLGALLGIVTMVRLFFAKGVSRRLYLAVFVIGMVTLALSQSRSPLAGFLLAMLIILFAAGKIGLVAFLGLLLLGAGLLSPLGAYFWQFFLRGQSQELFFSLSGRVYYWEAALQFILENPLLGYGAYAGGRFLVATEFGSTLSSLHGTWPEVLIGTGVLGLIPLIAAVVSTWFVLVRARTSQSRTLREQLRLEAVGVMTLLSVRSIFSVSFIWHPALTWLLALGYAEFLRRHYAHPSHPQPLHPARR